VTRAVRADGLIQVYALDLRLLRHRSASLFPRERVAIDLIRAMMRTVGRDVASCAKPTIAALPAKSLGARVGARDVIEPIRNSGSRKEL
jgi:hypothetical protein